MLVKSNFLSAMSGSLNGTTFARNAAGAYARNRTVPVNPNTTNQVTARAGLTLAATTWRTLTDLQMVAWKTYAQNTPRTNRIGDVIHLSGIGEYMKLNAFLTFIGNAQVSDPPGAYGAPNPITAFDIAIEDDSTFTVTNIEGSSTNLNAAYGIWISNAVSPGVSFYKGPWSYVGAYAGTAIATATGPIPYAVAAGQLFYVRIRFHDEFNRLANEQIFGPFTATTPP